MPVEALWKTNPSVREAILTECLDAVNGGGPDPVRHHHLACVVDWALRERHRGDRLERLLIRHVSQGRAAVAESQSLTESIDNMDGPGPGEREH